MEPKIIDVLDQVAPKSTLGPDWRLVTDGVMGGKSEGKFVRQTIGGRQAARMLGEVSLSNGGGFVQISLDLSQCGQSLNATNWNGVELEVFGNSESYEVRLRTEILTKPWQSYRQAFFAEPTWKKVRLPFDRFIPHRTDCALDVERLHRLGIIAIGRKFSADLSFSAIRFYC